MPRELRVPLIDGDRCTDDRGNIGSARKCLNRASREYFIGVKVIEGPDKDTWGKAYQFRPLLDYEGGTVLTTCTRCDRAFLSRPRALEDLGGRVIARDSACATCQGRVPVAAPDRDTEDYIGSEAWKTKHHARDDGAGPRSRTTDRT